MSRATISKNEERDRRWKQLADLAIATWAIGKLDEMYEESEYTFHAAEHSYLKVKRSVNNKYPGMKGRKLTTLLVNARYVEFSGAQKNFFDFDPTRTLTFFKRSVAKPSASKPAALEIVPVNSLDGYLKEAALTVMREAFAQKGGAGYEAIN